MKLWQWVVVVAAVILAMATAANATDCPGNRVPYGPPDSPGVHLTQPNQPAAYIYLYAPDGTTHHYWTPLFGQFTSSVAGQWYVCYLEDATEWLNRHTPTTTTTATTPATPTTTSTLGGTSAATATPTTTVSTRATTTTAPRSTITPIPDRPGWYKTQSGLLLT